MSCFIVPSNWFDNDTYDLWNKRFLEQHIKLTRYEVKENTLMMIDLPSNLVGKTGNLRTERIALIRSFLTESGTLPIFKGAGYKKLDQKKFDRIPTSVKKSEELKPLGRIIQIIEGGQ
jgi:hypothetical protein